MPFPSDSKEISKLRKKITKDPYDTDARNDLGVLLLQEGKASTAYGVFRDAIKINPTDSDLWCNLGIALKEQGNVEAATMAIKRAIKLCPDIASYYINLTNIYFSEKKFDDGIAILDGFLGGKYDDPAIRINLALAYKGKELYGLAIDQLEIAEQLTSDPNEKDLVQINKYAKNLIKEIKVLRYTSAPDTKVSIKQITKKAMEQ